MSEDEKSGRVVEAVPDVLGRIQEALQSVIVAVDDITEEVERRLSDDLRRICALEESVADLRGQLNSPMRGIAGRIPGGN